MKTLFKTTIKLPQSPQLFHFSFSFFNLFLLLILTPLFIPTPKTHAEGETPTYVDVIDPTEILLFFESDEITEEAILILTYSTKFPGRCRVTTNVEDSPQIAFEESYFALDHENQINVSSLPNGILEYQILCQINDDRYSSYRTAYYEDEILKNIQTPEEPTEPPEEPTDPEDPPEEEPTEPTEPTPDPEPPEENPPTGETEPPQQDQTDRTTIKSIRETVTKLIEDTNLKAVSETYTKIAPPVLFTSVTAIGAIQLISYPYSTLYGIIWLKNLKRKKSYGLIYDAKKGIPLPFAILEVYQNGKFLKRTITQAKGRYSLILDQGTYELKIKQSGYETLNTNITIPGNNHQVSQTFHLAPKNTPYNIVIRNLKSILGKINKYIFLVGYTWSLVAFVLSPSIINLAILAIYFVQLIVQILNSEPRDWGYLIKENTKERIKGIQVQIYLPKTNQLVFSQLTDEKGRFGFNLPEKNYELGIASSNYQISPQNANTIERNGRGYINFNPQNNQATEIKITPNNS